MHTMEQSFPFAYTHVRVVQRWTMKEKSFNVYLKLPAYLVQLTASHRVWICEYIDCFIDFQSIFYNVKINSRRASQCVVSKIFGLKPLAQKIFWIFGAQTCILHSDQIPLNQPVWFASLQPCIKIGCVFMVSFFIVSHMIVFEDITNCMITCAHTHTHIELIGVQIPCSWRILR